MGRVSKEAQSINTLRDLSDVPPPLTGRGRLTDHKQLRHGKFAIKIIVGKICSVLSTRQAHPKLFADNLLSPHYNLVILITQVKIPETQTG